MSIQNDNKLQRILANWIPKTVGTSSWLGALGISPQLVKRYVASGWIEPIGQGAFKRPNETLEWQGALSVLQMQMELPVHLGGPSAIAFQGSSHYARMGKETVFLFTALKIRLSKWFYEYDWGQPIVHAKTASLPSHLGTNVYPYGDMKICVSTVERAILECLYLSPKQFDLLECYQIMEGLQGLRPKLMQDLLESCTSIKVKRLFLFMADKANLPVMKHLKLDNVDLGKGDRSIVPHGQYNAKYGLTLPKELLNDETKLAVQIEPSRVNNEIHRESAYWSKQVHQFLYFLRKRGFNQAPLPLGFDEQGREIVSFVKGKTCDYPLSDDVASLEALVSAAKLLRSYHDASQSFLNEIGASNQAWMFPCRDPQEVICHSDFAPYNICFEGKRAVGIIDFDTAHPGPRVWDIAYALYRFAPFSNPENVESFGGIEDQILRAYLFCNAYGLNEENRIGLVDLILERLRVLLSFLMQSAREGNKKYAANVQNGHHLTYLADIEYITLHKLRIENGLIRI